MKYLVIAALFVFSLSCPAYAVLQIQDLGGMGPVEDSDGMMVGQYSATEGEFGVIVHDEYGVGYLSNDGPSGKVEFSNGESDSFIKHDVNIESGTNE